MVKSLFILLFFTVSFHSFSQTYDELVAEGRGLLSQRKFDESLAIFEKAIELDKGKIDAIYGKAVSISGRAWQTKSNFENALKALEKVKEMDENFANLNFNLATIYVELNKYDLGLKYINKQIDLNKEVDPGCFYQRGIAYIKLNKKKEACKDFKKALKLGDNKASQALKDYCK